MILGRAELLDIQLFRRGEGLHERLLGRPEKIVVPKARSSEYGSHKASAFSRP